jgi:hypothetical protein
MKLYEQQDAFARDVANLIKWIHEGGYSVIFREVYRTPELAALYAQQGKSTHDNLHTKSLAVDLHLFDTDGNHLTDSKYYKEFGAYWEDLHPLNRWGGIKDSKHFERQEA